MEENKKKRGGYRPNAGRPVTGKSKKYPTGIRLPLDLYSFLRTQKNKSEFVEEVFRFYIQEKGIKL